MNSVKKKPVVWPPENSGQWPDEERQLLAQLAPDRLPRHLAIIMDGNGRWAKSRGWADRIRGHEAGIESVREATRTAAMLGIGTLTLYAFSKENWQRPRHETAALMRLLERFAVEERDELMENDIRLTTIGLTDDLPASVRNELTRTIELTRNNPGTNLVLALSYGGRSEIVRAAREAARQAAEGRLDPDSLDERAFAELLDTAGSPDPDLLIRTSGEFRVSNFLLWQIAYAELYVTPVLWPDFRRLHILQALVEYNKRERRFGGLAESDIKPR